MDDDVIRDPEMRSALGYVPAATRGRLTTLFALDARLGGIVARASEPTIGLMRLVWWRDALEALDGAPVPAEPLLAACAKTGVAGVRLAAMVAGWEALLDDPELGDATVDLHATERGGRLFVLAGEMLGDCDPRLAAAGDGWARVDLARHLGDASRVGAVLASARVPLASVSRSRWPRRLRPLGQLATLAREDAERGGVAVSGGRRRLLRILRFHLTGR